MLTPKDLALANRAKKHGIVNPIIALQEAKAAGISYALACALLMQESGGGHNVFGHDPSIFAGYGTVTKERYLRYKAVRQKSGNRQMQGIGPVQLTWWEFQDKADALGGCWNIRYNMRVGFELLASLIKQHGSIWSALKAYNGSAAYADQVSKRCAEWTTYL